ncbi:MAG: ATP-binding protein [Thiotrichaceae bacterium]
MDTNDAIPIVKAYTPEEVSPIQVTSNQITSNPIQGAIKPRSAIMFPWQARVSMFVLFFLFVTIGATYFWVEGTPNKPSWVPWVMTLLWIVSGVGTGLLMFWVWREFCRFGNDLAHWVESLRSGYLSERMPVNNAFCPSYHLRKHINSISIDYQQIAGKLERRLQEQERYIKQKKHYLSVLYDVASCINQSHSLDGLLNRFLLTLKKVVNAESVTVKLLDEDGRTHKIVTVGIENDDEKEQVVIPIQYRNKMLGVYNISVEKKHNPQFDDEHELLLSIGQHLGMAIEKANVDNEARTLSIMEERTRMAHELHDSLAQTLASMRYKVRLLDDTINTDDGEKIWAELEGLEGIIDEANTELRSLITDFRAPIDGRGLVRSIEHLSKRFQIETSLEVFFYQNWHLEELSRDIELEAVRIVQEALANIRKHSKAETVRILMHSTEEGECRILVEDDGVGFDDTLLEVSSESGNHIGLTIMQERAARINGEIQFESEVGEGTLIQLSFMSAAEEKHALSEGKPHIPRNPNESMVATS